ncbi:hypothetical protein Rsub_03241 [Raphidocelis subcapitata]|uniref:TFIIS N-terminal domain-containing protein n=1 Tax=Raphidocelis subcapitata TaxID=307507 RepID=A0A2V0NTN0_9CHLO|nr:hypothetical protein Rsub_03241 [Raphidocelis subcapitata]|eukprot:GBF90669.1 hypothetical protein Rsub_03241 [Raphidocelis subcapitata]
MERFLVPRAALVQEGAGSGSGSGLAACSSSGRNGGAPAGPQRQARIEQLSKVVVLPKPRLCVDKEELLRLKAILRGGADRGTTGGADRTANGDAREQERRLVEALRQLSCYVITPELLAESWVGPLVRGLRGYEGSEDVRRLAAALIEKWRSETRDAAQRQRRAQRRNAGGVQQAAAPRRQQHKEEAGRGAAQLLNDK